MKARYVLPVLLVTLAVGACGKKDSQTESVTASATVPVITNPMYPTNGLSFDQQCLSQGGQMISLNGQTVCRAPGVNTSLYNYSMNINLGSSTYPYTSNIPVRRGDTLRITNSGDALTGYIYAFGGAASSFSIGSSYVGLQSQDGYLGFYIPVPSGFSSVKLKLSQIRTERCFNASGNFYQCP